MSRARSEAERVLTSLGEQRRRVHTLLGQAMTALEAPENTPDSVLADLSSRLRPRDLPADDTSPSQAEHG